ncbi:MAG: hypothetical protein ACOC0U_04950, partial [Desulfovibrionales bacterium]
LNGRPADYESAALPTELRWLTAETLVIQGTKCRQGKKGNWSGSGKIRYLGYTWIPPVLP